MKHNVEAFKKYYINATKEEVIEDMFLDCCEQAKEIERLTKQNKALNEMYELTKKEYIRLNNIINELEKWIKENNLGKYRTENVVNTDELLDKLQELKGSNNGVWVNNLLNFIKENNIDLGSDKE